MPAPPARPAAKPTQRAAAEMAELNAGIRQTGPTAYAVSRDVVTRALGSPTALRRSARFRVKQENGRTVGMEVMRMRTDSPLARLGLKVGDVVRSLNGSELASPTGALQALQIARSESALSLAVTRGGAALSLDYQVQ